MLSGEAVRHIRRGAAPGNIADSLELSALFSAPSALSAVKIRSLPFSYPFSA
jgi:hypothetical protein